MAHTSQTAARLLHKRYGGAIADPTALPRMPACNCNKTTASVPFWPQWSLLSRDLKQQTFMTHGWRPEVTLKILVYTAHGITYSTTAFFWFSPERPHFKTSRLDISKIYFLGRLKIYISNILYRCGNGLDWKTWSNYVWLVKLNQVISLSLRRKTTVQLAQVWQQIAHTLCS